MDQKLKILLISGIEAYPELQKIAKNDLETQFDLSFLKIETSISAFITPKQLENALLEYSEEDFDLILASGLIPWDLTKINVPIKPKLKKGPRYLTNLAEILKNVPLKELSSTIPADKIFKVKIEDQYIQIVNDNKEEYFTTPEKYGFSLPKHQNIIFSQLLPPVIIAEIVDFPLFSYDELCQKVDHYIKSGAQIIDLGCISSEEHIHKIQSTIPRLIEKYDIPFSIDSLNPLEIQAAVEAGVEMVLSITFDNYHELLDLPKEIVIVIVPIFLKSNEIPRNPSEKLAGIIQLGKLMSEKGFTKILMDPLTDTPIKPGLVPSIEAISMLKEGLESLPETSEEGTPLTKPQIFMGIGNVVEMVDADSSGINSLLALIGAELGVSGYLTTEYSKKSRHSIEEMVKSAKMAYLAKMKNVPPLNLGINAFSLKSKNKYPSYLSSGENLIQISDKLKPAEMDPLGFFKIFIDEKQDQIIVSHFENNLKGDDATISFQGTTAESLYKEIINRKLISRLDHAAYLGKELQKAEQALNRGSAFFQD